MHETELASEVRKEIHFRTESFDYNFKPGNYFLRTSTLGFWCTSLDFVLNLLHFVKRSSGNITSESFLRYTILLIKATIFIEKMALRKNSSARN